ncbi:protein-export chaperone SecB [Afifella marina]|uniref:Protein-export protein SecB n=1 Tax=Afifella marina DSM 2698 TaxID=1120955 RepID=A0A1G5NEM1_AFIMA|nr:protein-export chaperone SecB [Afifella marina]MBK1623396.1 protein-export chaperone SecB [Afifella marina DSM 2698]MBK1626390.1 protein-export chaperone SecB [Afifella marina]MBK5917268.1 protein-export chaperone SecB [Afifella marina]RAI18080.1 protein-export chaperone SecB [Afifella marina DSM 2698]SCZ35624.1 protein translocase subunit secB [Afifella marina DSM 2698]
MVNNASNGGEQAAGTDAKSQASAQGPGIHVLGQYIKDLSFENPSAPNSLRPASANPSLDVNVNVNARPIADGQFEVELKLDAKASRGDETLFITEVVYAGLFQIRNVPQEHLHPIILIECPRLLFPFARQILADATRQGGFPPLMIDPVDFAALYRQRAAQAQADAPTTA